MTNDSNYRVFLWKRRYFVPIINFFFQQTPFIKQIELWGRWRSFSSTSPSLIRDDDRKFLHFSSKHENFLAIFLPFLEKKKKKKEESDETRWKRRFSVVGEPRGYEARQRHFNWRRGRIRQLDRFRVVKVKLHRVSFAGFNGMMEVESLYYGHCL